MKPIGCSKEVGSYWLVFVIPTKYIFDFDLLDKGQLVVQNRLPYSDLADMKPESLKKYMNDGFPLEFSHTLTDLLGGQIQAGFNICGFYEDVDPSSLISTYFPEFYATLAIKQ